MSFATIKALLVAAFPCRSIAFTAQLWSHSMLGYKGFGGTGHAPSPITFTIHLARDNRYVPLGIAPSDNSSKDLFSYTGKSWMEAYILVLAEHSEEMSLTDTDPATTMLIADSDGHAPGHTLGCSAHSGQECSKLDGCPA